MAEKWARLHSMPFPPIREAVKAHLDSPIKECYVFKEEPIRDREDQPEEVGEPQEDENDLPDCPVVIFFPMVNSNFKTHK